MYFALVLPILKRHQENKVFLDEQGGKAKRLLLAQPIF